MIDRAAALRGLSEHEFDVVVIGGGITGAGVALDASTRGYSVALVEGTDFAAGTSSRSSKLIHGGLRYLQKLDLGLVREALLERQLMVSLAPHLVRPLPLVVAAFGGTRPDRLMGLGLNLYDVMSIDRDRLLARRGQRPRSDDPSGAGGESWSPERHRTISGEEVLELLPALRGRDPTGGYLFYDCQTDDARLVLTVLGEAERFGALCANRLWVTGPIERGGRVRGVWARDQLDGSQIEVRAENVVNATGVWADRFRPSGEEALAAAEGPSRNGRARPSFEGGSRAGARRGAGGANGGAARPAANDGLPRIRPSRGTHITVGRDDLPLISGAIVPAGGGRSIFALPWLGRTLIGTTDVDYEGDLEHVAPAGAEVEYLLEAVNGFFGCELHAEHLTGAFAGVRPLISNSGGRKSADISRRAECYETAAGMITITGGKLTTWRRMAKLVVDRLVEREARNAPCRTDEIPLGQAISARELRRVEGVAEDVYEHLAARYGHAANHVLALAAERPELAQPIVEGQPDMLAEVVLATRHEQAGSVGDVLARRTRLALIAAPELTEGQAAPRRVAELLAGELGWSEERIESELGRFARESAREGLCLL